MKKALLASVGYLLGGVLTLAMLEAMPGLLRFAIILYLFNTTFLMVFFAPAADTFSQQMRDWYAYYFITAPISVYFYYGNLRAALLMLCACLPPSVLCHMLSSDLDRFRISLKPLHKTVLDKFIHIIIPADDDDFPEEND